MRLRSTSIGVQNSSRMQGAKRQGLACTNGSCFSTAVINSREVLLREVMELTATQVTAPELPL